jgi:SAM-dependent methyltransferase
MDEKYDKIGINYNQSRKADPHLVSRLQHFLTPKPGGKYLDIGCGTGNYTVKIHQEGISFTGVDPSAYMLEKARARSQAIEWLQGKAEELPLSDKSVDGIIASLTLHHWDSLEKGFSESFRVLQTGSRIVIFTSTPAQMEGYWLNHYFPAMLKDSIEQMPDLELVESALSNNGFLVKHTEKYFIQPDLQDHFLYVGKHRPHLYLDAQIRQGISSFSALANQAEVKAGLQQLEEDIASGAVQQHIESYENDLGDYLLWLRNEYDV